MRETVTGGRAESDATSRPIVRLSFLRPLVTAHQAQVAVALALTVAGVGAGVVLPLVWKEVFDVALPARDVPHLTVLLVAALAIYLVRLVLYLLRAVSLSRLAAAMLRTLRVRMSDHLLGLPLDYFRRVPAADVLSRFGGDLALLDNLVTVAIPRALSGVLLVAASLVLMFVIEWRLALLCTFAIPAAALLPRRLARGAGSKARAVRDAESEANGLVEEIVASQPVVPLFGLTRHFRTRLGRKLEELEQRSRDAHRLGLFVGYATILAVDLCVILVIGAGSILAVTGHATVGSLIGFFALLLNVTSGADLLSESIPAMLQARGRLARIQELLSERPAEQGARTRTATLPPLARALSLRGVTFSHEGREERLLDGLVVEIPRGARVALVGPSGSGKSTVLGLLLRIHSPERGIVAWDGVDVDTVEPEEYRSRFGAVLQDSLLFDDTIWENIRLGRLDATDAEIREAARDAEVEAFAEAFPQGYGTRIGAGGRLLSGGQRQRVAIARALLRSPEVLILDEVTAALDAASESAVNRTIDRLGRGRTVVASTHRLAAIQEYDRILVFEAGRLVQSGTHDELMGAPGTYRELVFKQRGLEVSSDGRHARVSASWLDTIPLLKLLDPLQRESLASRFVSEYLDEGRTVVTQGETSDRFYCLARGELSVTIAGPDGRERAVNVLRDGDHFGEIALLRNTPRTATLRTRLPTVLLSLSRQDFEAILAQAPGVRDALEREVALRIERGGAGEGHGASARAAIDL